MLCFVVPVFSQLPTDFSGDYSNWDWEDPSIDNWKRVIDGVWVPITPPFASYAQKRFEMDKVYSSGDYTKSKGWQLVYARFESKYPYFILYNPHTSIVRAFFSLEDIPYTHVLATLCFNIPNQINFPGILTYGNGYQNMAADKYWTAGTFNNNEGDNDMISVIIPNITPNGWGCANFPITFDPNIKKIDPNTFTNGRYDDKRWAFDFYGCNTFSLEVDATSATGESLLQAQLNLTSQKSANNGSTLNATNNLVNLNKKVDSFGTLIGQIRNTTSFYSIPETEKVTQNGEQVKNVLLDYKKGIENITTISTYAKALLGFVNLFTGIFDDTKASSTASYQAIKLKGKLSIQQTLGGQTLKIPGVNGDPYPAPFPYDCVMGIMNLETTPTIHITTPYEKYEFKNKPMYYAEENEKPKYFTTPTSSIPDFYAGYGQLHPVQSGYLGKYRQCKFDDNLTIAVQDIDGLELLDIKVALMFKTTGTGLEKIDITQKYYKCKFYNMSNQEVYKEVVNPIFKQLEQNTLQVYRYEKDTITRPDNIYIGTPMLNVNQLKGIVIEIPEKADVFLRVQGKYNSDRYSEDLYFQRDYKMDIQTHTATWPQYFAPFYNQNFTAAENNYYLAKPYIELNSTSNLQYTAAQIVLKPGFKGQSGFKATAVDIYPNNGSTTINPYYFNCDIPQNSPPRRIDILEEEQADIENFSVYPNPNKGQFYLSYNGEEKIDRVVIFDVLGRIVYQNNSFENNFAELEINSNFAAGIYTVQMIVESGKIYSQKIIINN